MSSNEMRTDKTKQEAREVCWKTRDTFFKCLDSLGVGMIASDDQCPQECAVALQVYKEYCLPSWVKYFNARRVEQIKQENFIATRTAERNNRR